MNNGRNIWLDGVMGVIVGDALGCPVQFMSREEIEERGAVTGMEGHGTYDMPVGTWTDDGSLTLALLASIREKKGIDLYDIMYRFAMWFEEGEYTPFGQAFDVGNGTMRAVIRFIADRDVKTCGGSTAHDNGNGSLMRILPACLYWYEQVRNHRSDDSQAIKSIHEVSGLTHNHIRAKMACGLYYFMVKAVLDLDGPLQERLQAGLDEGFRFYEDDLTLRVEMSHYGRLRTLREFADHEEREIASGGYVVEALEAAAWSLIKTNSFSGCLLQEVNLGDDTDTTAAIAGGLAGLYYGYEAIPKDWLDVIQRREWIEELCSDVLK